MNKPVHIGEDTERLDNPETHEEQEKAVEVLDELLVATQLVEVCLWLTQVLQVELFLQLVSHDDGHDGKHDLTYVVDDWGWHSTNHRSVTDFQADE